MTLDLVAQSADEALQKSAIERISSYDTSPSRQKKMEWLVMRSPFSGVYCKWLLSDDFVAFRNALPHNRQLAKNAEDAGLEPELPDLVDSGIQIPFAHGKVTAVAQAKLKKAAFGISEGYTRLIELIEKTAADYMVNFEEWVKVALEERGLDPAGRPFEIASINVEYRLEDRLRSIIDERMRTEEYKEMDVLDREVPVILRFLVEPLRQEGERYSKEEAERVATEFRSLAPTLYSAYSQGKLDWQQLAGIVSTAEGALRLWDELGELGDRLIEYLTEMKSLAHLAQGSIASLTSPLQVTLHELEITVDDIGLLNLPPVKPSSKQKGKSSGTYTVKRETLLPDDVDFGNDGGACIGIYDKSSARSSVPFYQLDNATWVFGIYQQAGERKPQRVGFVLSFLTSDEQAQPVLLLNSVELSEVSNPIVDEGLAALVRHTLKYISAYADQYGILSVAIGTHAHNTGYSFLESSALGEPVKPKGLMKLPDHLPRGKRAITEFYSEVLDKNGDSSHAAFLKPIT